MKENVFNKEAFIEDVEWNRRVGRRLSFFPVYR